MEGGGGGHFLCFVLCRVGLLDLGLCSIVIVVVLVVVVVSECTLVLDDITCRCMLANAILEAHLAYECVEVERGSGKCVRVFVCM